MGVGLDDDVQSLLDQADVIRKDRIDTLILWNRGLVATAGILVLFIVAGWSSFAQGVRADVDGVKSSVDRLSGDVKRLEGDVVRVRSGHNGFVEAQRGSNQAMLDVLHKIQALLEERKVKR